MGKLFSLLIIVLLLMSPTVGYAQVATVRDASAVLSNPAALAVLSERQVQFQFGRDGQGENIYFVSYVEPDYGYGAGGLSFRQAFNGEQKVSSLAYSVAKEVATGFSGGLNVRYQSGEGQYITSDLGVLVQVGEHVSLGVATDNILYWALNESERNLHMNVRAGLGFDIGEIALASVEVNDLLDSEGNGRDVQLAVQFSVTEMVSLRAGYIKGLSYDGEQWSAGSSVGKDGWQVEYTLAGDRAAEANYTHQLGVTWSF